MNGFSYFILKNCEKRKKMERCALKWRKKTAKYKSIKYLLVSTNDPHVCKACNAQNSINARLLVDS